MPTIKSIPEEYSSGFQGLFLLTEEDFLSIVEGLKNAPLTSDIDKLSMAASAFNPAMQDEVESILLSVGSLTSFIEKGLTIEDVSNEISNALSSDISEMLEDVEIDDEENRAVIENLKVLSEDEGRKSLANRVRILLNTERLYYAAKATDLMWEYPSVFVQGRIVTDIRPIFKTNIDDEHPVAVVVHTLNIHYRGDDQKHRDVYFALDSADLKALKDILIRAEQKEKRLISVFNKSGIKIIND